MEASPMMIEPASGVRSFLERKGVEVSVEEMLRILEKFPDRFEILPARDGKLILLKKSWAYAQD
jgi:hypothetical protein